MRVGRQRMGRGREARPGPLIAAPPGNAAPTSTRANTEWRSMDVGLLAIPSDGDSPNDRREIGRLISQGKVADDESPGREPGHWTGDCFPWQDQTPHPGERTARPLSRRAVVMIGWK